MVGRVRWLAAPPSSASPTPGPGRGSGRRSPCCPTPGAWRSTSSAGLRPSWRAGLPARWPSSSGTWCARRGLPELVPRLRRPRRFVCCSGRSAARRPRAKGRSGPSGSSRDSLGPYRICCRPWRRGCSSRRSSCACRFPRPRANGSIRWLGCSGRCVSRSSGAGSPTRTVRCGSPSIRSVRARRCRPRWGRRPRCDSRRSSTGRRCA